MWFRLLFLDQWFFHQEFSFALPIPLVHARCMFVCRWPHYVWFMGHELVENNEQENWKFFFSSGSLNVNMNATRYPIKSKHFHEAFVAVSHSRSNGFPSRKWNPVIARMCIRSGLCWRYRYRRRHRCCCGESNKIVENAQTKQQRQRNEEEKKWNRPN